MFPKLIEYHGISIYTYAFCIALGTLFAVIYAKWQTKKILKISLPNSFIYLIFIAGFLGGKLFLFFEKPLYYIENYKNIGYIFPDGFVFYGSFICIIVTLIWYLKKKQFPLLPMLDILAITTTIVHMVGRTGCFFAGCCYGKPTNTFFGIIFPNTHSVKVHPTQLYEVFSLFIIMIVLLVLKRKQQFQGQIFLLYVSFYAIARSCLEVFRGDNRGFIIDNLLSHSQFIALGLLLISGFFYLKLNHHKTSI